MSITGEVWEAFRTRQRRLQLNPDSHIHGSIEEISEQHRHNHDYDGCAGVDPLSTIEQEIKDCLKLIDEFKNHKHEWDEHGFCYCGWDGNA